MRSRLIVLLTAAAMVPTARAAAQGIADTSEAPFQPQVRPSVEARRAVGPIALDGRLDDAGWAGAARIRGFTEFQPGTRVRPPQDTEVLIAWDDDNLYLGFIAWGDAAGIRASLTDRDRAFGDDWVGVVLDTYGNASWAYLLGVNPLGVQLDERFTNNGEDDSFDVVFESAGLVTDSAYFVELALPFSSLRFPQRAEQTWRVNFVRNYPRASRHQSAWAALDPDDACTLCQSGTLRGVRDVKPGGQLELLPALVASQAGSRSDPADPASSFDEGRVSAELSLGARYPFAAGVTAELALNPDFSQVESDAAQIDVNSTFALFYPERRPFFQEGSDLFTTWTDAIYTRSINDPVAATKLIGRMGGSSAAYIGAYDRHSPLLLPFEERSAIVSAGESWSNIVRGRTSFGSDSWVGALVTDRRLVDGGSGSVLGADGLLRIGGPWQFQWQLLASHTAEPEDPALTPGLEGVTFDDGAHTAAFDGESYWGRAGLAALRREARTWSGYVRYREATPTYRTGNGFQTRNDYRRVDASSSLQFHEVHPLIDRVSLGFDADRAWNFAGEQKLSVLRPDVFMMLTGQTELYFGYTFSSERFRGVDFDGMRRWELNLDSNFSAPVSLGMSTMRGDVIARTLAAPQVGTGSAFSAWATVRPTPRTEIRPSFDYETLSLPDGTEVYAGYILRGRLSYQFTRELYLRLVAQYDDFSGSIDLEPLLMYRLNPLSIVYLGSTHGWQEYPALDRTAQTERQLFLKVQYLFRP